MPSGFGCSASSKANFETAELLHQNQITGCFSAYRHCSGWLGGGPERNLIGGWSSMAFSASRIDAKHSMSKH